MMWSLHFAQATEMDDETPAKYDGFDGYEIHDEAICFLADLLILR